MNEKYNIPKFTETYRKVEHHQTHLIPILMILVVVGCYVLVAVTKPSTGRSYGEDPDGGFSKRVAASSNKGRENSQEDLGGGFLGIGAPPKLDIDLTSLDFDSATIDLNPTIDHSTIPEPINQSVPKARVIETPPPPPAPKEAKIGNSSTAQPNDGRYTIWMTPQELNEHILSLNNGFDESFWDRGHWIVAVGGQLNRGVEKYRIIYEKVPYNKEFSWKYRISQTRTDFASNMRQLKNEGFKLVHSQSFTGIDNQPRYQAVWQRLPR